MNGVLHDEHKRANKEREREGHQTLDAIAYQKQGEGLETKTARDLGMWDSQPQAGSLDHSPRVLLLT